MTGKRMYTFPFSEKLARFLDELKISYEVLVEIPMIGVPQEKIILYDKPDNEIFIEAVRSVINRKISILGITSGKFYASLEVRFFLRSEVQSYTFKAHKHFSVEEIKVVCAYAFLRGYSDPA